MLVIYIKLQYRRIQKGFGGNTKQVGSLIFCSFAVLSQTKRQEVHIFYVNEILRRDRSPHFLRQWDTEEGQEKSTYSRSYSTILKRDRKSPLRQWDTQEGQEKFTYSRILMRDRKSSHILHQQDTYAGQENSTFYRLMGYRYETGTVHIFKVNRILRRDK